MSSIPRFFVSPADIAGEDRVLLPADAAHHARNVLRLRPGEAVLLHDGAGGGVRAELTEVTPKAVRATVLERFAVRTEPRVRVTVAQALPKTGEKVEQVLQHGTEVGAAGFLLFPAQRSVARLDAKDKAERRIERWRGIIRGAAEQSGRGVLPEVEWIASSADALAARLATFDAVLVLHEAASVPLRQALTAAPSGTATRVCIVVGPEGGLTEGEVARFTEAGAVAVSLGPRILRTETAALVALAQILYARDADAAHDADSAV